MNRGLKLSVMAVCCAVLSLSLPADEPQTDGPQTPQQVWNLKRSDATRAELERRASLLKAEIDSGAVPEWAGEYYFGDGLGVNVYVVIAPQGGFIYTWTGCLGLYDANYGAVQVQDGRLTLQFELPKDGRVFAGPSEIYVPVRWGERHYLIGADQAREFANAINARENCEFCARLLLRDGDEKKEIVGRPTLPPDFARFLLEKPIDAQVVRIIESVTKTDEDSTFRLRTTKVQIDVGRANGVWEGMEFFAPSQSFEGNSLEVEQVNDTSSFAVVREMEPENAVPEAGFCISTRASPQACRL